jgi:hypothetical protein
LTENDETFPSRRFDFPTETILGTSSLPPACRDVGPKPLGLSGYDVSRMIEPRKPIEMILYVAEQGFDGFQGG